MAQVTEVSQPLVPQAHLCQQQEVVEQEAVELFAALGLEQFPTVEELAWAEAVGDRVEDQLL